MTPSEYQAAAIRTAKMFDSLQANLIHASLGLATETGEFTTEVKRAAIYGKEITEEMRIHLKEELGDTMWYIALACHHLEIDLGVVMEHNIHKLRLRFPEKYSDTHAEARLDKGGADARSS